MWRVWHGVGCKTDSTICIIESDFQQIKQSMGWMEACLPVLYSIIILLHYVWQNNFQKYHLLKSYYMQMIIILRKTSGSSFNVVRPHYTKYLFGSAVAACHVRFHILKWKWRFWCFLTLPLLSTTFFSHYLLSVLKHCQHVCAA